jgi:hypothetical protein
MSGFGVVGAIVVILGVTGIAIFVSVKKRPAKPELHWQSFSPPGGQFRLMMPAAPEAKPIPGAEGARIFIADLGPQAEVFMAQFVDLDEAESQLPLERVASDIVGSVLKMSPESKQIGEKAATLAGQPAREVELYRPREKVTLILRLCVIGRTCVSLGVAGPAVNRSDPVLARYFDSFEIIGPVAANRPSAKRTEKPRPAARSTHADKERPGPTVLVVVSGVEDDETSQIVQEKLKALVEGPRIQAVRGRKGTLTVSLSPVPDPQALADKINFGTVTKVQGRTIRMTFEK